MWRGIAKGLLVVELVGIAYLVLNPSAATPTGAVYRVHYFPVGHGIPGWAADPSVWEFLLNVALFVPLTFLAHRLWPRVTWLGWTLAGAGLSALLELAQRLVLEERSPTVRDLVANSTGALLGAGLAATVLLLVEWRRQPVTAAAPRSS